MKILRIFILLTFTQLCFGQNCKCERKPELNEIITCEKTVFKNGAKVYRQFSCDSSWVVFESKNRKKRILFSLDKDLIELTGKLGFAEWFEYKKSFLVEYHTISGCCDPYEYILFDKATGKKIANIGRQLFASNDDNYPYIISIDKDKSNFLSFLNLETNRIFKISLPKGRIEKTMKINGGFFSETLFEEGEIKNGVFEIQYKYKNVEEDNWLVEKVSVDLKKYGS